MATNAVSKPSSKAIFWLLFAAGGTVCAFVLPAMIFITGIGPAIGLFDESGLSYASLHGFLSYWIVKLALFGIIFLALWHAAHRLRVCAHDFGIRADSIVAIVVYGLAAIGTLATIIALLRI
ncbi:MAG: fumarate reductase subunit D [Rhodospirillales bacterium]|nr:fumarate reductase subunit D [Rhodospirillales bacterium]